MKQQQKIDELEKRVEAIEQHVFPKPPPQIINHRFKTDPNPDPVPLQPLTDDEKEFLKKSGFDPDQRTFEMRLYQNQLTSNDRDLINSIKTKRGVKLIMNQ